MNKLPTLFLMSMAKLKISVLNGWCTLLKNVDYDALHFHTGLLKINNFKVLFLGGRKGSHKKRIMCMLLIMFKILDDTLDHYLVEQTTSKQRRAAFSVAMEVQGH